MKKFFQVTAVLFLVCVVTGCASFKQGMYEFMISADRSRSCLKPGTVSIDGRSVAYLERKGRGETIVLIHGFGANKDNWIRFVRNIPEQYRIIAFDMPGHGDNDRPEDKTYTIDFMVKGLSLAVDALGIEKFHIAGNSMGGYISILYAARNPQKVMTMCLLDNAGLLSVTPLPSDLQVALLKGQSPLTPTSETEFSTLMEYCFYKEPFIPWPITSVLADRAVESSTFNQKMWKDLNTHDVDLLPLLPGLKPPVLVIWGDHDRILHVSTTEVLKQALPKTEIVIMKDCGHLPMLERPEETAQHYVSFLNRHAEKH